MRATTVHFLEVGREKRSWDAPVDLVPRDDLDEWNGFLVPSADWLAREARRGGKLMSRDIEICDSDNKELTLPFVVFAGIRVAGYGWIELPQAKP